MLNAKNLNIYYGRKKIIENASFIIKPGDIVGLIGPNGAGKTTIMKTILGLTKFTGKITFNNQQITLNNHAALKQVGALIENPAIYPFLTGKDNLKLYSKDNKDMYHVIHLLGMDSYINKKAKDYSIGMKQKLGIALALLNKPKFVILDEPMNGLDIESTILIRKIIHEYAAQGTSFLVSSHVLSELQKVMTSVIIINHGKIIVNSPIATFNQANSEQYKIKIENLKDGINLLNGSSFPFTVHDNYLIIARKDLLKIEQLLLQHNIKLSEVSPTGLTFEQKIVNILREKRGEYDEKRSLTWTI